MPYQSCGFDELRCAFAGKGDDVPVSNLFRHIALSFSNIRILLNVQVLERYNLSTIPL